MAMAAGLGREVCSGEQGQQVPALRCAQSKASELVAVIPLKPTTGLNGPPNIRLWLRLSTLTLVLLLAGGAWGQGKPVVLDHVVAVINGSVILQSDVDEERAYSVLQPFSINAASNTPQNALQRLIDRALILQQMETAQSVAAPTAEALQQSITQLRGLIPDCAHYQCVTDAGWQAFLQAKGLTGKEVEVRWRQRLIILSFIQSRFGAGVRIGPAEIADYYHKTLLPQFNGKMKPPTLEAVSSRVEEILLQQRVSSLLLDWLQSLKSEGSVSILDPAYGQVGTTGSGDEGEQS
jgi:peptidyl-prolyl cis-trans isomerase SurA